MQMLLLSEMQLHSGSFPVLYHSATEHRLVPPLLFAGEKTRRDDPLPAQEIQTVHDPANFRVIALESLIAMKLLSNRAEDGMHLRDLISVR
jgi:hypothetical protein